jgi:nitrogenase molybdenum-iron protein alpha chain
MGMARSRYQRATASTAPSREERLQTITAYIGSGKDLEQKTNSGCLKLQDRRFSQAAACAEMMPLCNSAMIDGNVVIAHSPVGCSGMLTLINLFNRQGRLMRGLPADNIRSISTNLSEKDVIFGGAEQLTNTILEAERRYHPSAITIITSCASGIIGDDIEAVVNQVQPQVKAAIIPIRCEGFRSGVVSTGYDAFLSSLLRVIQPPKKKRKNTVLLINPLSISRANEIEVERLLSKAGLKAQWFPLFTDFSNIQSASEVGGASTLCSLMSNYFLRELNKRYDVPFAEPPMPVGVEYTAWWLRDIGKLMGVEDRIEEIIAEESALIRPQLDEIKAQVQGRRAYIGANLEKSLSLQSLLLELGIETVVSTGFEYSDDYGKAKIENLNARCDGQFTVHIGNFQHFEWANLFHRENPDLLVGGLELGGWALRQGIPVAPVLPHTFFFGYGGAVNYGKEIVRALRNTSYSQNLSRHVHLPYRKQWFKESPLKYIGGEES